MDCIKTCPEIYKLSQQTAQALKNQSGSTDLVINYYKQQLQLKDKMIEKLLDSVVFYSGTDEKMKDLILLQHEVEAKQALAELEE